MPTVIDPPPSEIPPSDARWVHPSWERKFLIGALAICVAFVVTESLMVELHHHPRTLWLRYCIEQLFLYGALPAMCFIGAMRTPLLARAMWCIGSRTFDHSADDTTIQKNALDRSPTCMGLVRIRFPIQLVTHGGNRCWCHGEAIFVSHTR